MLIGFEGKEVPSELSPIAAFTLSYAEQAHPIVAPGDGIVNQDQVYRIATLAAKQPMLRRINATAGSEYPIYFELINPSDFNPNWAAVTELFDSLYSADKTTYETLLKNNTLKPFIDRNYIVQAAAYSMAIGLPQMLYAFSPIFFSSTQIENYRSAIRNLGLLLGGTMFNTVNTHTLKMHNPSIAQRPQFQRDMLITSLRTMTALFFCVMFSGIIEQDLLPLILSMATSLPLNNPMTILKVALILMIKTLVLGTVPAAISLKLNKHHPKDNVTTFKTAMLYLSTSLALALTNAATQRYSESSGQSMIGTLIIMGVSIYSPVTVACHAGKTPGFPDNDLIERTEILEPVENTEQDTDLMETNAIHAPACAGFWHTFQTNATDFENTLCPAEMRNAVVARNGR